MPTTTLWPLDELSRVFPRDLPPRDHARQCSRGWNIAAARGEYAAVQLGIHTSEKLADVSTAVSDLKGPRGMIAGSSVRVRWASLVPVPCDVFDAMSAERPEEVPGWFPDPLTETPPWSPMVGWRKGQEPVARSASIHLSIQVPRALPAGRYRGSVRVSLSGKVIARVPLVIEVWPFAIPKRPRFQVSNWFHLDCLTKHHRCEPWSERHWKLLDLYARDMAEHRQNVVSTPTLIGNFHSSDPMTLVDTTRKRDGTWAFDFRRLARWVKLFRRHGVEQFEMWHFAEQALGKLAPPFSVFDEKRNKRVMFEKMRTDSRDYRTLLKAFLQSLTVWLEKRKLTHRFLMHVFDEPHREHWQRYAELSKIFREHAPCIRQIDAISASELITKFGAQIDVPVPLTYHLWDADQYYANRANAGNQPVWWYTCSGPTGGYANRFVCSPTLNTRMLQWQAFAFGISGYLHWGLNFWHRMGQPAGIRPGIRGYGDETIVNPYREHPPFPVGDAAIVYPHPRWWEEHGPVGSLRWEAFRAGLQDYELLRTLDDAVKAGSAKGASSRQRAAIRKGKALLRAVRGPIAGDLTRYCRDKRKLLNLRRQIGDCVATLTAAKPESSMAR